MSVSHDNKDEPNSLSEVITSRLRWFGPLILHSLSKAHSLMEIRLKFEYQSVHLVATTVYFMKLHSHRYMTIKVLRFGNGSNNVVVNVFHSKDSLTSILTELNIDLHLAQIMSEENTLNAI